MGKPDEDQTARQPEAGEPGKKAARGDSAPRAASAVSGPGATASCRAGIHRKPPAAPEQTDPCIRAESEDDDGYDPYSDRRPAPEPMFEPDPWR